MSQCPCDEITEWVPNIPAGLDALPRQPWSFPEVRESLLRKVGTAIPGWLARDAQDLGVMWLEMWAYVSDVLAFYDERIANESYLRTAQRRPSLRRHVELLGYLPKPGIAGSVVLALEAEGRRPVDVPEHTGFRSEAFGAEPPQVYELSEPKTIDPLCNQWEIGALRTDSMGSRSPRNLRCHLSHRAMGQRLAQHRPIVTQTAVLGFGLSGVQTDSAVTSVVGAAATKRSQRLQIKCSRATAGRGATNRSLACAFCKSKPSDRRISSASSCDTRVTCTCTILRTSTEATSAVYAFPKHCLADSAIARPTLANVTALPAVVRVRKGIRASGGGRPSRSSSAYAGTASRRAAATARNRRSRGASTDARSVLHALVVHAGESAVAGARRQAGATELSLSASAAVVIIAAAAGARHGDKPDHQNSQHPQSLVQSHRMIPFPYQRPEAFHASLREATLLEMAPL